MFESAELNHDISKKVYRREEPKLRQALLEAQNERRRDGRFAVLVLIAGVEGAGKGETVNLLNEWMDPRYIESRIKVLATLCGAIEGALKRAGKKGEEKEGLARQRERAARLRLLEARHLDLEADLVPLADFVVQRRDRERIAREPVGLE